jgi:hypothetical protein
MEGTTTKYSNKIIFLIREAIKMIPIIKDQAPPLIQEIKNKGCRLLQVTKGR